MKTVTLELDFAVGQSRLQFRLTIGGNSWIEGNNQVLHSLQLPQITDTLGCQVIGANV